MKSEPSDLLIIGGSGFVSGTLAETALRAGHNVWVVTRGQRPLPAGVIGITADRSDRSAFQEAIEQANMRWDLVVDCIGYEVDDAHQDIAVFRERAGHFVFISTDFVYDPAHRNFPQRDDNPHFDDAPYGGKKRLCELALLDGDTGPMRWTILRPCHIYGPGSLLGCLPDHGRDPDLIETLRAGRPLRLVGGGSLLQQPIFVRDLADLILSCVGNQTADHEIYQAAGPDIIESREYYRIIAEVLGVELKVEELPVGEYLAANPDKKPFLCHRIYDLKKLRAHGLRAPATPIADGLREHVLSLLE